MPLARRRRPALRYPALGPAPPGPEPSPGLESPSAPMSNNDLFQEFMQTCIKRVQAQAPTAPAASSPDIKVRDNTDRLQKP